MILATTIFVFMAVAWSVFWYVNGVITALLWKPPKVNDD